MLFSLNGQLHTLGTPLGFLRFPMGAADKLRFVRLILRAFNKSDWSDWHDRSAVDLIDAWGGPGVRHALFESLTQVKFELPCREVSGAWLGARLHFREGSAPLGYIPNANWTKVLCDGLTRALEGLAVRVRTRASIAKLHTRGERLHEAELSDGERISGDLFVSTVPTEVYLQLLPHDATPHLASIRYSALLSVICATRQRIDPDFYWMVLPPVGHTAGGLFMLNSLNPTIGAPGDACVNFVTHLQGRHQPLFKLPDDALLDLYRRDLRKVLGLDLQPFWTHIARVPMYSPIFTRGYHNPAVRSATWQNVYLAGNYRTFPSIASTGTAMASGLQAAQAILQDYGGRTDLSDRISAFRLRAMPRG